MLEFNDVLTLMQRVQRMIDRDESSLLPLHLIEQLCQEWLDSHKDNHCGAV